jgi:Zn ribbon nucleic-acid-binding protein
MSLVPLVRSCVACGFVMSEHPVPIKATVVVEVDGGLSITFGS